MKKYFAIKEQTKQVVKDFQETNLFLPWPYSKRTSCKVIFFFCKYVHSIAKELSHFFVLSLRQVIISSILGFFLSSVSGMREIIIGFAGDRLGLKVQLTSKGKLIRKRRAV